MLSEIKLFLLTKHLMALYDGDKEKVQEELERLLPEESLHPDYWHYWMTRYEELGYSKETQIMLLREAGLTYRVISDLLNVSPNTINRVLNSYTLNYGELEDTNKLSDALTKLGERLEKAGYKLW